MSESINPSSHNFDPSLFGDALQEQNKVLGGNEVATIQPPETVAPLESFQFGEGETIQGSRIATLELGGERQFSEVVILDVRQSPVTDTKPRITESGVHTDTFRQIGTKKDGKPITRAGDFLMLIPSATGGRPQARALVPGHKWDVGRREGFIGNQDVGMPDTVSRDHCAVGMNDDGSMFVENHEPTNITRLIAPPTTTVEFSSEKKGETIEIDQAVDLLSYTDVLSQDEVAAAIEFTNTSANGLKYAQELQAIVKEQGLKHVTDVAQQIQQECLEDMQKLGITPSKFAESRSWALWDIAKQRYYLTHPEERDEDYDGKNFMTPRDPLAEGYDGIVKRGEIIDRHIGWEADLAASEGRYRVGGQLMDEAQEVINRGERNHTGQLRSYELAKLGRRLRRLIGKQRSNPPLKP